MTGPAPPPDRTLVLHSRVAETGRLHAWLDEMAAASVVPDRLASAVRLCLEEAVVNVITHGYGRGRPGEIEVTLAREPGALRAAVADDAGPFDPTAVSTPPSRRAGLQDGPLGGRGLRLMRRVATRLDYARSGGRNLLTLRFEE